ncbi:MAG: zf-HC2 domain-containing protein [Acidobacteriota bacterium]
MTTHASTDLLSAYLDGELSADDSQRIAEHVADCPACRADLASLRRVIDRLRRVERAAPPPVLAQHVQRRVALEGRPQGLVDRLENRLGRFGGDSSILSMLGVILALLLFIYLFSVGVERERGRSETVIVPVPDAYWPEDAPAAGAERPTTRSHLAGERTFHWSSDRRWVEQTGKGLTDREASQELLWPDALAAYPWLAELPSGWREVRFVEGDQQIVVRPSPAG